MSKLQVFCHLFFSFFSFILQKLTQSFVLSLPHTLPLSLTLPFLSLPLSFSFISRPHYFLSLSLTSPSLLSLSFFFNFFSVFLLFYNKFVLSLPSNCLHFYSPSLSFFINFIFLFRHIFFNCYKYLFTYIILLFYIFYL